MKTIRRGVGSTVLVASLGLLVGCGMSPKAEAPRSAPEGAPAAVAPTSTETSKDEAEAEPSTLAEAEARLEKARVDLERLALNEPGAPAPAAGAPAPARPPAQPSLAPARAEGRADKAASSLGDGASAPPARAANACETTCKAFSSLSRASDAVCRLDTEGGKRCERARQIRNDASQRVASCGCAK